MVSIVVISRDRRQLLEELVERLKAEIRGIEAEIVVFEETTGDSSIRGVRYFRVDPTDYGNFAFKRNRALKPVRGEIVVFIDDDCLFDPGWLGILLTPLASEDVLGVQGGVRVPPGTNAIGWVETILGFPGGGLRRIFEAADGLPETVEISTLNCAYKKSAIERAGGFCENLKIGGEDYILAKKIASFGRLLFVPRAVVYHRARGSLRAIWHWMIHRGRAELDVARSGEYQGAGYRRLVRTSVTVKLIVLTAVLWLVVPAAAAAVLVMVAYGMLQMSRYYRVWAKTGRSIRVLFLVPAVKFVMDVAKDVGVVKGMILDGRGK